MGIGAGSGALFLRPVWLRHGGYLGNSVCPPVQLSVSTPQPLCKAKALPQLCDLLFLSSQAPPTAAGGRPRSTGRLPSPGSSWLPGTPPGLGMSGVSRMEGRGALGNAGMGGDATRRLGRNLAALLAWARFTSRVWFWCTAGRAPVPQFCSRGRPWGLCTACFSWLQPLLPPAFTSFRSLLREAFSHCGPALSLPSPCFMFLHSTSSHATYYISLSVFIAAFPSPWLCRPYENGGSVCSSLGLQCLEESCTLVWCHSVPAERCPPMSA